MDRLDIRALHRLAVKFDRIVKSDRQAKKAERLAAHEAEIRILENDGLKPGQRRSKFGAIVGG